MWAGQVRAGVVRWPYGAAVRSLIHERDLAAVAVLALTEGGHAGRRYLLAGPQAISQQVETIGEAIGRPVRWEEAPREEARPQLAALGDPASARPEDSRGARRPNCAPNRVDNRTVDEETYLEDFARAVELAGLPPEFIPPPRATATPPPPWPRASRSPRSPAGSATRAPGGEAIGSPQGIGRPRRLCQQCRQRQHADQHARQTTAMLSPAGAGCSGGHAGLGE